MKCPNCNSEDTVKVVDSLSTDENEIYRKRKCTKCGHKFFTCEFEVEVNKRFKSEWVTYNNRRLIKNAARKLEQEQRDDG